MSTGADGSLPNLRNKKTGGGSGLTQLGESLTRSASVAGSVEGIWVLIYRGSGAVLPPKFTGAERAAAASLLGAVLSRARKAVTLQPPQTNSSAAPGEANSTSTLSHWTLSPTSSLALTIRPLRTRIGSRRILASFYLHTLVSS